MEFIAYRHRSGTLREQLLCDCGKEVRSHCQSAAGEMRSLRCKIQGQRKSITDPGENSEQKEPF
jgi:hypothetical protein